ncbi:acyltransferase [Dictyocaulus viviparus]|uniref:Acyltransferase n=1 Tax=Dictyocaulus viviparus TaxID=29172 RepID=A0A0D8XK01_DICVI|nr:acyltransferase [Dictyocaulus viviparus]
MAKILCGKPLCVDTIQVFYVRRFKRIVPLYVLVLVAVYIYGYFYLIYPFRNSLATDISWALTFTSNMQPFYQETGYWIQLSTYNFLVHMWSLAVEWQYYIVVPLVIGLSSKCSCTTRIAFLIILCTVSISFQLLTPSEISFGFLLSRIWQFTLGSIIYELTKMESILHFLESNKCTGSLMDSFLTKPFIILLPILVFWSPQFLDDHFSRIFASVSVAVVIFIQSDSSLLTNKFITYFGDISYALYLVHWPIIVATKYHTDQEEFSLTIVAFILLLSLALSVVIHHSVEV